MKYGSHADRDAAWWHQYRLDRHKRAGQLMPVCRECGKEFPRREGVQGSQPQFCLKHRKRIKNDCDCGKTHAQLHAEIERLKRKS